MKAEIVEVGKQEMKKKEGKNKGFSLVELIVVIAIMAILAIVIAPNVMKYIRQSKDSVDDANMALYKTAATTALSNEKAYSEVAAGGIKYTITIAENSSHVVEATYSKDAATFKKEFEDVLIDGMKLPQEPGCTKFVISIDVSSTKEIGKISVEAK
ncbi:type II secretion system protein [Anaerosporobacter sp.]|uniref:type II secretion system protein n=1 Tax=Anaerosporobacter sp. TaxID=1872529 RepID=UPI00286FA197|nr:type II secretion system protein [Anaerosporobacter sp.]